jgi:hypothetical protein
MNDIGLERRLFLMAPFFSTLFGASAVASPIDPEQTFVAPPDRIEFKTPSGAPPRSTESANLYGDINRPGLYLVMIRWFPGWFSAPHSYATDRIQVVLSGARSVCSGSDFAPQDAAPAVAGSFVKRTARTMHYDGVPRGGAEPALIAVFGMGPVDIQLADPSRPLLRQV